VNAIITLRQKAGLTRKVFARFFGFSERAIAGWETGQQVSEPAKRRAAEMQRLINRLSALVDRKEIPTWLQTPNKAFDGLKPLEVIERGEMDRLWSMIFFLESGVAS
jgi:transcriptional regulator with XRE-family HTH domain